MKLSQFNQPNGVYNGISGGITHSLAVLNPVPGGLMSARNARNATRVALSNRPDQKLIRANYLWFCLDEYDLTQFDYYCKRKLHRSC